MNKIRLGLPRRVFCIFGLGHLAAQVAVISIFKICVKMYWLSNKKNKLGCHKLNSFNFKLNKSK